MSKAKLHFLVRHEGRGLMALQPCPCRGIQSYASYACCLMGESPGDCFQGPVYSICQLCFTYRDCLTFPCVLSFYPRAALWRSAHGAAAWLHPGAKGHHKKRDLLKKSNTELASLESVGALCWWLRTASHYPFWTNLCPPIQPFRL